jgi:hypothetical protein
MKKFKEINGTFYNVRTKDTVVNVLENCRKNNIRIILDYGDVTTGESWEDIYDITGRLGRSTGTLKVPILLYNKRSIGGNAILDHCIIGIKESKGGKILYTHDMIK